MLPEPGDEKADGQDGGEDQHGQQGADGTHHRHQADDRKEADDVIGHQVHEKVVEPVGVVVDAGHQGSGGLADEEAHGQPLHGGENLDAQLVQNVAGDLGNDDAVDRAEKAGDKLDAEDQQDDEEQLAVVFAVDRAVYHRGPGQHLVVEHLGGEHRHDEGQQAADEDQHEDDHGFLFIGKVFLEESLEGRGVGQAVGTDGPLLIGVGALAAGTYPVLVLEAAVVDGGSVPERQDPAAEFFKQSHR